MLSFHGETPCLCARRPCGASHHHERPTLHGARADARWSTPASRRCRLGARSLACDFDAARVHTSTLVRTHVDDAISSHPPLTTHIVLLCVSPFSSSQGVHFAPKKGSLSGMELRWVEARVGIR